jgi:hypothetical protein
MPDDAVDPSGKTAAEQLVSLTEAAEACGLSAEHLRALVRSGKVWGTKIGRNWVTTTAAVKAYTATERRPGPKPKISQEDDQ